MKIWRRMGSIGVALAATLTTVVLAAGETPVAQAAGKTIQLVVPARLADTRVGEPTVDGQFMGIGRRDAHSTTPIQIAGRGNVPPNAAAVQLNVTDVSPSDGNYLTVFPCADDRPMASNLNTPVGDIRANNVFVQLSATGSVCVYTDAATDFIIDVNGFVLADGAPVSVPPSRLFDSRVGESTVDGQDAGVGLRRAESMTRIQIAGRGNVPLGAPTAIINVTDVQPSDGNVLIAFACYGDDVPETSSVNTSAGDIRANNLYVPLDEFGDVCIYTAGDTNFIVDVYGYVPNWQWPLVGYPYRMFDSRPEGETLDGKGAAGGPLAAGSITEIQLAGRFPLPGNATAAIINVTSVFPTVGNYLTVYPCGTNVPTASTINSPAGDIRANEAFVQLGPTGSVCVYTKFATDLVVDFAGYVSVGPYPLRAIGLDCETEQQVLTSVAYSDDDLDGKKVVAGSYTIMGVPPYAYESTDLKGYSLDRNTGALTRTSATNGVVNFTLTVSDAAGSKLVLPAKVTWSPFEYYELNYQAYLPNGQTVAGPPIVNWGAPPLTFTASPLDGLSWDRTTTTFTYKASPASNGDLFTYTAIDSTGRTLVTDVSILAVNRWNIAVGFGGSVSATRALDTFNTSGWGTAPYKYQLTGDDAEWFSVDSSGRLFVADERHIELINDHLTYGTRAVLFASFKIVVTDATGATLTVPVVTRFGNLIPHGDC